MTAHELALYHQDPWLGYGWDFATPSTLCYVFRNGCRWQCKIDNARRIHRKRKNRSTWVRSRISRRKEQVLFHNLAWVFQEEGQEINRRHFRINGKTFKLVLNYVVILKQDSHLGTSISAAERLATTLRGEVLPTLSILWVFELCSHMSRRQQAIGESNLQIFLTPPAHLRFLFSIAVDKIAWFYPPQTGDFLSLAKKSQSLVTKTASVRYV